MLSGVTYSWVELKASQRRGTANTHTTKPAVETKLQLLSKDEVGISRCRKVSQKSYDVVVLTHDLGTKRDRCEDFGKIEGELGDEFALELDEFLRSSAGRRGLSGEVSQHEITYGGLW